MLTRPGGGRPDGLMWSWVLSGDVLVENRTLVGFGW